MSLPRILFISFVGLALAATALQVPWEARLRHGPTTYFLGLDRAPLWSRPSPPPYARLAEVFDGLPADEPLPSALRVTTDTDGLLTTVLVALLPAFALGAILGAIRPDHHPDRVLRVAVGGTLGAVAAGGLTAVLWLALGSWGPPFFPWLPLAGLAIGGAVAPWLPTSTSDPTGAGA